MRTSLSTRSLCRILLLLIPAAALPLTRASAAKLPTSAHYQPADVTVQGVVTDEKGTPLPGATIVLKGSAGVGISAEADGKFSLAVPDGNATPVISSVGYVAQEVALAGKTTIAVQLITDNKASAGVGLVVSSFSTLLL